jgi:predicted secreted protein
MMTKYAVLFLMTVIVFSSLRATPCESGDPRTAKKSYIVLTGKDNDTRINVKLSQVLLIVLEAQPGTGYTWQAARTGKLLGTIEKLNAREIQELMKDGSLASESNQGVPGSPEEQVFRLTPIARGVAMLELRYVRVWEPEKAARTFRLTLQVT